MSGGVAQGCGAFGGEIAKGHQTEREAQGVAIPAGFGAQLARLIRRRRALGINMMGIYTLDGQP